MEGGGDREIISCPLMALFFSAGELPQSFHGNACAGGRQEGRGQHERVQRARLRRRHAEVRRPLHQQVLAWPWARATQGSQVRSRGCPTRKKNNSYYIIIK